MTWLVAIVKNFFCVKGKKNFKSAVKTIAAYALESITLNRRRQACSMPVIGWWFALHSASIGIATSRTKNFTLNPVFFRSVKLSEKEDFTWSATRCVFKIDLPIGLWSMLQNLYVVFSLRRGKSRTWTLARDLLYDLNTIDCNINDVINFSSSQFTRLVDSLNSNFYCWRTSK